MRVLIKRYTYCFSSHQISSLPLQNNVGFTSNLSSMNFVQKHKETRPILQGSDNCVQFIGFFARYCCLHRTTSVNLDAHMFACLVLLLVSAPKNKDSQLAVTPQCCNSTLTFLKILVKLIKNLKGLITLHPTRHFFIDFCVLFV